VCKTNMFVEVYCCYRNC